jgi:sugar O-acyltransferase (sialic acid O-acetyltransferase NeuD family)
VSPDPIPVFVGKEVVSDDHYIVVELRFADGAVVEKGAAIGSLETSKGVVDVVAPAAGHVFYNVAAGDEVAVGKALAAISPLPTLRDGFFAAVEAGNQADAGGLEPPANAPTTDVRWSKAARALAERRGVDPAAFAGRAIVREADVLAYLEGESQRVPAAAKPSPSTASPRRDGVGCQIVVIGGGGHAKMCIDVLRQMQAYRIAGVVDAELPVGSSTLGVPVLGGEEQLEPLLRRGVRHAVVGFGALNNPASRQTMFDRLTAAGFTLPNLIHPRAIVEPSAVLGAGNQIMAGAIVGSDVRIGDNCIVNSGSVVSHDCRLADNVHVTPGALLAGHVEVGADTIIGMGATVFIHARIGANVVINNGVRVARHIPDGEVVKGGTMRPR